MGCGCSGSRARGASAPDVVVLGRPDGNVRQVTARMSFAGFVYGQRYAVEGSQVKDYLDNRWLEPAEDMASV